MPWVEKRGDGPYPYRVRWVKPNGKQDGASGFADPEVAYQHGLDMESDVRRNTYFDKTPGKKSFGVYAEEWLEGLDLKGTSEVSYRSRVRRQMVPEWGEIALVEIQPTAVRKWEKRLRATYAKNTVDNVMMVFRTMMDDAIADKLIQHNPAVRSARRGKRKKKTTSETPRIFATPLQALEIARNAYAIRGEAGATMIATLAYSGMRIAELYGLQRGDCVLETADGEPAHLNLCRQFQYEDGQRSLPEPKYEGDRRLILPPFLADMLSAQLARHDSEFVFLSPRGKQMIKDSGFYSHFFRPAVDGREAREAIRGHKALVALQPVDGVVGMVPHGFRHGLAVWLDEDRLPDVAIEELLGHVIPGVKGVYRHTTPEMKRDIAAALQARWEKALAEAAPGWPNV